MTHALIVTHGQPSDPEPAEAVLAAYAADVNALCAGVSVHSATLAAPGALDSALDKIPGDAVIYPLFMAKGWFVTDVLPKRIGDRRNPILDPLGADPKLPQLVAQTLEGTLQDKDWRSQETDLVIAAHGSGRSRNPSAVATAFGDALLQLIPLGSLRLGFVEEAPSISVAAAGTGAQTLCLPFFACTGGHVLEDVPQELSKAKFKGQVLPVVGELPLVQQHIASVLKAFSSSK
ncbi:CbiX/SirB N-terminal domain-containing protein [Ruegeria faecimaris]|uniref:Sirohydrochlorin ferrochelatase n=1 Tax=Ruegeria faecimaris TaxID=686389 RepID=A0A521BSH8_9RHOB|nr:CbiX/SirB N-terminal domain-containing protein [Ruegeria faecimaris]SMO50132.1 Sirohydrochlorin ferrochelatase [Ruegeria faecimaris]